MSLALVSNHEWLACIPLKPLDRVALHYFTDAQDPFMQQYAMRETAEQLKAYGNKVALDVADSLGHSINMELLNRVRNYLQNC